MTNSFNLFTARRDALARMVRQISGSGIVILNTSPELSRNRDSDFPYRHDSDFYYLTGFDEPQAYVVLQVNPDNVISHLFCRPKNIEREIWDGIRLGPEAAPKALGVNFGYSIDEINVVMPELMTNFMHIYYRTASSSQLDDQMRGWVGQLANKSRQGIQTPTEFHNIEKLIHEQRLFKDDSEISIMRKSAKIAAQGHLMAMQTCKPGLQEFHLEASLLYQFRKHGAQSVAYNSIVAAGENACILHYRAGNSFLKDGDLCLIDAGCELDSYASDITRTFPVNGKFSAPQQQVYEIVLAAQESALEMCFSGNNFQQPHEAALKVLTQGLFDMKVLNYNQHGSVEDAIKSDAYKPYYMHRTSHWLGMDVHDVGSYREPNDPHLGSRILRPGMVLTIEPGLYFRPSPEVPEIFWNIGIRIEDDVVIGASNYEILSRDVPVKVSEIEYWMANGSMQI
ncbi:Xaa-Pro aminopeptidase [Polynucleobacter sp. SHI8]|uniref:aminopeptidase P N-terminal domain-containing protein n=1 Tax=unclassified Polynucleobacter TaxID=2640945 RepID=UPI002490AC59|nr:MULTISPECIES: aminopeptidase P N-terminal domain-containing protein [unclassified Polynucleobacter]BDW12082.1 Xaa-Pro aminopeptidase [Polynucleobacter sp. SHI2]BDW14530.1 Xaa-Pro aminopeptidase [Polynucleobacter sp. SHI8]